jgi:hypothetical protein
MSLIRWHLLLYGSALADPRHHIVHVWGLRSEGLRLIEHLLLPPALACSEDSFL